MTSLADNQPKLDRTEETGTDFSQLIAKYLSYWHWFVISSFLCLSIAYLYTRYATKMYNVSARILVNDEKKGGGVGAAGSSMLGDLGGLLGGKSTVDNEAEIIKTKDLAEKVVKDLQLNVTYYKVGRVKSGEVYVAPFIVRALNLQDKFLPTNVRVQILDKNQVALQAQELDTVVNFNKPFFLPEVGRLEIIENVKGLDRHAAYSFDIQSVESKVAALLRDLEVSVPSKLVTIIDLNLKTPVPQKGEDILNRLIYNYVQTNLSDKNEIADSTISFIKRRLMVIGSELNEAEGDIQGFKQKNSLADMTEQGRLLVATSGQYISDLAKTETQISVLRSLLEYMNDDNKNRRVLPSTLIPQDLVFSGIIEKYNSLLLERGRKLIGLTPTNPVVINLDREIANARQDIESNLNSTLDGLLITRNRLQAQMSGSESQIKQVPAVERNYLQLSRQQQIKQELYLFLMQKSEETAISKTANIANSKTIDRPRAEMKAFEPKKYNIAVMALGIGLLIPIGLLYVSDLLNNKIETTDDITNQTDVPIIGEIVQEVGMDNLAVAHNARSAVSEQFRALRTNLSFYLKKKEDKVILLTSSMSGEGKSFVAINLGNILALSGKRVVLMELDLRKPGLSTKLQLMNTNGFTNYVISNDLTVKDIIKPLSLHENLFLVSSGPLPPNPAETLMSSRTVQLIEELKEQFDYIIIDAPPVGIITDAQLLSHVADMCIYLVRHQFTSKQQIKIVRDLSKSNKMKQLGIVVNGIKIKNGYGYGYGYGTYGEYGSESKKKGGIFSSIFRRS